jgi:HK97 family phage prohead protease
MDLTYAREWPLDDIVIRSGGDGRTVEAYAAVFDTPTEIRDQHGHYMERVHRSAFNRAISHGIERVGVFYHHGMTLHGTPSDLGSVPIASPLEIRADHRGLLTVSRYNKSALADSVLESIRNGDIRGYSFKGRVYQSEPKTVTRTRPGEPLPTITRMELGLSEYGPTPSPAYAGAGIVAVRSMLATIPDERLLQLLRTLPSTPVDDEDPDDEDTATSTLEPGAEDPPQALRSAADTARRIRVAMLTRGM